MSNELLTVLEYIEQERGISRESLIRALESAILTASRQSISPASDLSVHIEPKTGKIQAWARLEVVEKNPGNDQIALSEAAKKLPDAKIGDVIEWEVTPSDFGRIAAQTARQAIIQQLRKAEKENVQDEFADRVGQIINGTVRRFEAGNIIIDFQRAEGIMPSREKIHEEQYMPGDRINVLLQKVDINAAGPSLIVSRATPDFVVKLFEREVSEMHDGIVKIVAISRDAGKRTKIAVASSDPRVDPVGACVGIRGTRVRRITEELGNERIDIIPFDENIAKFAANALQPAKVQSIEIDEAKHELTAWVDEEQSKLAFGRKAQNIRLAAKLVGWNITIKNVDAEEAPKESLEEKMRKAAELLSADLGVSVNTAAKLVENGFVTLAGVKIADAETLLGIDGIDADELKAALDSLQK
ncbi:MAG: transcription termination factor NusA [Victivallaceae bacterium]|nr:transcription termination factor NusA [Victivallaceae bacterium]